MDSFYATESVVVTVIFAEVIEIYSSLIFIPFFIFDD